MNPATTAVGETNNLFEAELYIPVMNERGEKIDERFTFVSFIAHCPTEVMNKALECARLHNAEHATFGRVIARDEHGMPDYDPKKRK